MIYGLAIAGGLVLLLVFLALRERMSEGERVPSTSARDGGVATSYTDGGTSDPWPTPSSTSDDWKCEPEDKVAEECATDENASDADQCDTGDSGSDGGSDGGGGGD